jgi:hypothetical protein
VTQSKVLVPDLDKLRRDLKKLDPQLAKDMAKALTAAAKPLVTKARTFVPSDIRTGSGNFIWQEDAPTYTSPAWANDTEHRGRDAANRWVWRPNDVQKGIKIERQGTVRKSSVFGGRVFGKQLREVAALRVINKTAAGAIFELAGLNPGNATKDKSRSRNPRAGEDFEAVLNRQYVIAQGRKKGRILYKAAQEQVPAIAQEVERVLTQFLGRFAKGL